MRLNKAPKAKHLFAISTVCIGLIAFPAINSVSKGDAYSYSESPEFRQSFLQAKKTAKSQGDWRQLAVFLDDFVNTENPLAKLEMALLYLKGWGVERDLEKARVLLLRSSQYDFSGRGQAAFQLGRIYRLSKGKDCNRIAFEWFTKSLQWGYSKAHAELGKSYARGLGVKIDYDLAIEHYQQAIETGSPSSVVPLFQSALKQQTDGNADASRGLVFANKYLPYLEVEANNGDRVAARALGRIFAKGLFVEKDQPLAIKWFSKAVNLNDPIAMHDLAMLGLADSFETLSIEQVEQLLLHSAELGYPAAMTALGRLYLSGDEVGSKELALEHLEKGVSAGHPGALEELATLLFEGTLVPQNLERARQLAEQGAKLKHRGSLKILTRIRRHYEQTSTMKDIEG